MMQASCFTKGAPQVRLHAAKPGKCGYASIGIASLSFGTYFIIIDCSWSSIRSYTSCGSDEKGSGRGEAPAVEEEGA